MRAVRLAQRHSTALWIVAGVILTLALRAPWLDAPLNRDEGGDALVAQTWSDGGQFAYGHVFLDRPPLLLALYRLAGDTTTGIRVLGAIAAALLVVTSTLLAVRVAGRRAAPYAAAITALLASSFALRAVLTPAELLAAVPASASVLLLVMALQTEQRRRFLELAGAGALAAVALLVKQSFADALAAGAVAIAVAKLSTTWRETAARAAAFTAGIAAAGTALAAWAFVTHTRASEIWFALFGFRIDSAHALANSHFGVRIARLDTPVLESGLAIAVPLALIGIALMATRPAIKAALVTWLVVAAVGVLLGGSYWPHYLIALVSVTAVGVAASIASRAKVAVVAVGALAAVTIAVASPTALHDGGDRYDRAAVTVGDYLRSHALPGQSAYVLYTDANVLYYSGLRAAFPYNWSLMMESIPGAVRALRHDLASPAKRPTWLVVWQPAKAYGLDPHGATRRLLSRNYTQVATVCGHRLMLARGAPERHAPPAPVIRGACATGAAAS